MKNLYRHNIDLKKITLENDSPANFRASLENLAYRGYEVEQLHDGRKVVITKPGGKSTYGRPKKEDFLVFIYNESDSSLWQITHKQILEDLYLKAQESSHNLLALISLLERAFNGEEPSLFIQELLQLKFNQGESPETLVKVYKWIWGQEDVNYPSGKGRKMSWEGIEELRNSLL